MTDRILPFVVVFLLVTAGCSFPFGSTEQPNVTSNTTELGQAPGDGTPTATTGTTPSDPYPPGVSESGLENATELLDAYVPTITETGYTVATGGNTTVERSFLLVDISSDSRITVEANGSRYYEQRHTVGGPVDRRAEMWGNETVEFYRLEENGSPEYERRESRHQSVLARRPLLQPYLEGGNFTVSDVNETADPATVTLNGTSIANETALRKGLPENAGEIRSFNATMRVDADGRILTFETTIGFSIGGENKVHTVTHELERIGNGSAEPPDWIDQAQEATNEGTATTSLTADSRMTVAPSSQNRDANDHR